MALRPHKQPALRTGDLVLHTVLKCIMRAHWDRKKQRTETFLSVGVPSQTVKAEDRHLRMS